MGIGDLVSREMSWNLENPGSGKLVSRKAPYLGFGDFPEIGSLYLGPLAIGLVLFVIFYGSSRGKREKSEEERNCRMAKASLSTAVIVLLLSFGKVGDIGHFYETDSFFE